MKKSLIFTLIFLGLLGKSFAQTTISFDENGTSMTVEKVISGKIVQKNYPLTAISYLYQPDINIASIYYNSASQETLYFGPVSGLIIAGVQGSAGLLELKKRLGNATATALPTEISTKLDTTNTLLTFATKPGVSQTFLLKDSTLTISGTPLLYWTACNTGYADATIQFAGETSTTAINSGMCYTETIWTDEKNKLIHEPSSATITATGGAQVQIIRKYR